MARTAKYWEAIDWIIGNDDVSWLEDEDPIFSVTLALVADLFGVSTHRATQDLYYRAVMVGRIKRKPGTLPKP